ncbi:hypothetical protein Dvar_08270 [Desulfosarcina variabilis str. Montpellier]
MIYSQIAKQTVTFQKTAFANWYNAVTIIQDQSAMAMDAMMSQARLPMSEAAHKAFKSWVNAYQEGFKRFHAFIESSFSSIEKNFVPEVKATPDRSLKLLTEEKKAAPAKSPKPVAVAKKAAPAKKKDQSQNNS